MVKQRFLTGLLIVTLSLSMPFFVGAYELDEELSEEVHLLRGELETIPVDALTKLAVADPEIIDINDAKSDEIIIIGKNIGQSALFVWDAAGKRTIMVYVHAQDLNIVKERLKELFRNGGIHKVDVIVNDKEGKVVVSGVVPKEKRPNYDLIVEKFSDEVLSLIIEEVNDDLIQIDLQIAEISETLLYGLGIEWLSTPTVDASLGGVGFGGKANPLYVETQPDSDGSIADFFKIGHFNRASAFAAQINALRQEGKARILSSPKLVTVSGEEASFLVGGEIPVITTNSTENGVQENIEYKEYGVGMTITPLIRKDKIDLRLNMEVSDIDNANSVDGQAAFTTRTAQTRLFLDDGQTIVIAGLIKQTESETYKKVPFLADIPILGLLFRTKGTPSPNQDTELVVSLTPHRLTNNEKAEMNKRQQDKVEDDQKHGVKMANGPKPYYSGIPREMTEYINNVQAKISQSIVYPREAKEYGWEGTVKVGLLILHDGTLALATVKESSGYDIFDEVALKTAKETAPYANFPPNANLQELNVTIPIVYSLNTK